MIHYQLFSYRLYGGSYNCPKSLVKVVSPFHSRLNTRFAAQLLGFRIVKNIKT